MSGLPTVPTGTQERSQGSTLGSPQILQAGRFVCFWPNQLRYVPCFQLLRTHSSLVRLEWDLQEARCGSLLKYSAIITSAASKKFRLTAWLMHLWSPKRVNKRKSRLTLYQRQIHQKILCARQQNFWQVQVPHLGLSSWRLEIVRSRTTRAGRSLKLPLYPWL